MRLRRWAAAGACAGLALPIAPAHADATTICTVTDPRITEGSGLVAVADGYRIVNDGGDQVVVYRLDASCALTGTTTAAVDPNDVEDLAIGPDGTLWLADIGDNNAWRSTVAVIAVPDQPGAVPAVLRRLQYPDGPHDAESMIVDDAGRAVIMTKTFSGLVAIYRSEPLDRSTSASPDPQPLGKIGEIQIQQTGTPGGPIGPPLNNLMATGAARCGAAVALRTYTDAYVWRGADPAEAITATSAAVVALPAQAQGESIAFTPDCGSLVVHGEGLSVPIELVLAPAASASDENAPEAAGADVQRRKEQDARTRTLLFLGGGLVLAVALAAVGLRRRR